MKLAAMVIAFGFAGVITAAQAMPLAPTEVPSAITTVAGGCGPGWRPDPWGRCVRYRHRWRPAPVYRGYGYYGGPRVYYGPPRAYYGGPRWHERRWYHREGWDD